MTPANLGAMTLVPNDRRNLERIATALERIAAQLGAPDAESERGAQEAPKPSTEFPQLLGIKDVAALTRTSEHTVRYWRSMNIGPPSAKLGRRVVYRKADVEAWIKSRWNEAR